MKPVMISIVKMLPVLTWCMLESSCMKQADKPGESVQATIEQNLVFPPQFSFRRVDTLHLSVVRREMSAAGAGNKVLFAGGYSVDRYNQKIYHKTVDIFNANTLQHELGYLSSARVGMAAAAIGNKIFFAGGRNASDQPVKTVDIYDVTTGTWSVAQLSEARYGLAAASAGSKILFAGGRNPQHEDSKRVDIYDINTNTWTTAGLNSKRSMGIWGAGTNNKVLFAGVPYSGTVTGSIDIYDVSTNTWSTAQLSVLRMAMAAVAAGSNILLAGGFDPIYLGTSDLHPFKVIDIYNTGTGVWTTAQLREAKLSVGAGSVGTAAVMAGGYLGTAGEYSDLIETWLPGQGKPYTVRLSEPQTLPQVVVAGKRIFIGGGYYNSSALNTIEVFEVVTPF